MDYEEYYFYIIESIMYLQTVKNHWLHFKHEKSELYVPEQWSVIIKSLMGSSSYAHLHLSQ